MGHTKLPTLTSLDAVVDLALAEHAAGRVVYARYSRGPVADAKSGNRSRNHVTGEVHSGLSVNGLTDLEYAPSTERSWVVQQLAEYAFMLAQGGSGTRCWLLRGTPTGRGADNELVVRDIEPVALVLPSVVEEARVEHAAKADREAAIAAIVRRIGVRAYEALDDAAREEAIQRGINVLYGRG